MKVQPKNVIVSPKGIVLTPSSVYPAYEVLGRPDLLLVESNSGVLVQVYKERVREVITLEIVIEDVIEFIPTPFGTLVVVTTYVNFYRV